MTDLNLVWIAVAAFGGGILSALFGWWDSKETFDVKKFMRSVGAGLLAALLFAVGYQFADGLGFRDIGYAILGGAGVDVLLNRALGTFK